MMQATAKLSDCGRYRYTLTRAWDDGQRHVLFIMLNPSIADALKDDPTIRKCVGFAKRWGFDGITVCNLYAFRATDPRELWHRGIGVLQGQNRIDVIGPENEAHVHAELDHPRTRLVVAAWGGQVQSARGRKMPHPAPDEAALMLDVIGRHGHKPHCVGKTLAGAPRHPLMLSYNTALERV